MGFRETARRQDSREVEIAKNYRRSEEVPNDDRGSGQRLPEQVREGASPRPAPKKAPSAGKPPGGNPAAKAKSSGKED